jgi:hypothetical protein
MMCHSIRDRVSRDENKDDGARGLMRRAARHIAEPKRLQEARGDDIGRTFLK